MFFLRFLLIMFLLLFLFSRFSFLQCSLFLLMFGAGKSVREEAVEDLSLLLLLPRRRLVASSPQSSVIIIRAGLLRFRFLFSVTLFFPEVGDLNLRGAGCALLDCLLALGDRSISQNIFENSFGHSQLPLLLLCASPL